MNDDRTEADKRFEEGLRILARIIAREHLRSLKAQEESGQLTRSQQPDRAGEIKVTEEGGYAVHKNVPNREAGKENAPDA